MGVVNTSTSIRKNPDSPREPTQNDPIGPDEVEEDERDRDGNVEPDGDATVHELSLTRTNPGSTHCSFQVSGTKANGHPFAMSAVFTSTVTVNSLVDAIRKACEPRHGD